MPDINVSKQTYNTIVIILGISLLMYDFMVSPDVVYFKIAGLVILMFGLYKSTQQWTKDNKTNPDEDYQDENHQDQNHNDE